MRSRFLTTLDVRLPEESGEWVLANPLVYDSAKYGLIVVPEGFTTDFASVPRLPITYALFGDIAHAPAVIHDYLYSETTRDRAECDAIFLEAMQVAGISWWKRNAMWLAVRAAGWAVRSKKK